MGGGSEMKLQRYDKRMQTRLSSQYDPQGISKLETVQEINMQNI